MKYNFKLELKQRQLKKVKNFNTIAEVTDYYNNQSNFDN